MNYTLSLWTRNYTSTPRILNLLSINNMIAYPVQQARLSVAQASFVALIQEHQLLDSVTLSFFGVQLFLVHLKKLRHASILAGFSATSVGSTNIA